MWQYNSVTMLKVWQSDRFGVQKVRQFLDPVMQQFNSMTVQ